MNQPDDLAVLDSYRAVVPLGLRILWRPVRGKLLRRAAEIARMNAAVRTERERILADAGERTPGYYARVRAAEHDIHRERISELREALRQALDAGDALARVVAAKWDEMPSEREWAKRAEGWRRVLGGTP